MLGTNSQKLRFLLSPYQSHKGSCRAHPDRVQSHPRVSGMTLHLPRWAPCRPWKPTGRPGSWKAPSQTKLLVTGCHGAPEERHCLCPGPGSTDNLTQRGYVTGPRSHRKLVLPGCEPRQAYLPSPGSVHSEVPSLSLLLGNEHVTPP